MPCHYGLTCRNLWNTLLLSDFNLFIEEHFQYERFCFLLLYCSTVLKWCSFVYFCVYLFFDLILYLYRLMKEFCPKHNTFWEVTPGMLHRFQMDRQINRQASFESWSCLKFEIMVFIYVIMLVYLWRFYFENNCIMYLKCNNLTVFSDIHTPRSVAWTSHTDQWHFPLFYDWCKITCLWGGTKTLSLYREWLLQQLFAWLCELPKHLYGFTEKSTSFTFSLKRVLRLCL